MNFFLNYYFIIFILFFPKKSISNIFKSFKNINYNYNFFGNIYYLLNQFQIYSHIPMIYCDFYYINKSKNVNTKLNYHFKT